MRYFALFIFVFIVLSGTECIAKVERDSLANFKYVSYVVNAGSGAAHLPVLIILPSMGSSPNEFKALFTGFKKPIRIILIQAPYVFKTGFSFYPLSPVSYYERSRTEKRTIMLQEVARLASFIRAVDKYYQPGVKPIVAGASQGGDLAYGLAIVYPELLTASCPLLGLFDPDIVSRAKKRIPIDAFDGMKDTIVKISVARKQVKLLKENGFDVTIHEYEGVPHDLPPNMIRDIIGVVEDDLSVKKLSQKNS
jgi:predicted esterase